MGWIWCLDSNFRLTFTSVDAVFHNLHCYWALWNVIDFCSIPQFSCAEEHTRAHTHTANFTLIWNLWQFCYLWSALYSTVSKIHVIHVWLYIILTASLKHLEINEIMYMLITNGSKVLLRLRSLLILRMCLKF